MEIDYAFLSNYAESSNGLFHVLSGGIDTLWSKQLPIVHPKLSLVLKVILDPSEFGRKHKLEIQIMDEDGGRIVSIGADLQVDKKNVQLPKGWKQGLLTVVDFNSLQFKKFSDYAFHIIVNNSNLKTIPFRVAEQIDVPVS